MRQQLRQLTGDTAVYGVTTVVQRFLSFLLTPFYTHFLLPEELGIQANIFVLIAFLLVVANSGMESAYFKFDSIADDEGGKRRAFWNAIGVNWSVAAVLGTLVVLMPFQVNGIAALNLDDKHIHLVQMAGIVLALDSMAMIPLGLLRMRGRAFKFGAIKIAAITVNVGLNVILVGFMDMKLDGVFFAAIIQSAVQFALTLPFVLMMRPLTFGSALRRAMLGFGLPTMFSGLSMIALQLIDRPIIQNLVGYAELGLYQANYRLGIVMVVFVSVFEFAWKPFFLQQVQRENARRLFSRVFTYFNLVGAAILLIVSFFIPNLAAFPVPFTDATIVDSTYWSGLSLVPIVLAAYLFNGWFTNFIVGIYVERKTSSLLWVTLAGAGTEAVLCFALVPTMGIEGGAWATLAAYLVMALTLLSFSRRFYVVHYEWKRVALILGGAGGILVAGLAMFDMSDLTAEAALYKLLLLSLFPLWLILGRFFTQTERTEMRRILRSLSSRGRRS